MLISTKPDSRGKEAVLFRSRLLTEFKWTPLADIPTYIKGIGKTTFPAGQEVQGMLYSSTEPTDKFICENISFETLMSIMANPDSALYQKDLNGHNGSWAYFGIVCNGLVRYALNITRRYSTKRWHTVPGMHKVHEATTYTAEQIQLCDVLHTFGKAASHVALITDILRDEDGQIRQIEVSEAIRPACVRRQFDVDAFFEKFKLYALWRYDFVDEVPMPDAAQAAALKKGVPELPVIAVDYGNKTNYRTCEDVVISVFTDGQNELEIRRGDEIIEKATFTGRAKIVRRFERGYYTIKHIATGEVVEFCVTEPQITHMIKNGILTVTAKSCDPDSQITHMEFREKIKTSVEKPDGDKVITVFYSDQCASLSQMEELTDEEKQTGVFARKVPEDAEHFKVSFRNKYGMWTHTMIKI